MPCDARVAKRRDLSLGEMQVSANFVPSDDPQLWVTQMVGFKPSP
jgi:hypothetical protein